MGGAEPTRYSRRLPTASDRPELLVALCTAPFGVGPRDHAAAERHLSRTSFFQQFRGGKSVDDAPDIEGPTEATPPHPWKASATPRLYLDRTLCAKAECRFPRVGPVLGLATPAYRGPMALAVAIRGPCHRAPKALATDPTRQCERVCGVPHDRAGIAAPAVLACLTLSHLVAALPAAPPRIEAHRHRIPPRSQDDKSGDRPTLDSKR